MKSIRVTISNPDTPPPPPSIQQTTLFRGFSFATLSPTLLDSNMASHRRSLNPPSSTTPTKVHPCEFYWHFRLDVGTACRDWGGLALPPLFPPSVFFTLPQPLSYTRNMINWCPAHPSPLKPSPFSNDDADVVAIPQNNGITSTVSSFPGKTRKRYFYPDGSLHD